jgi:hypothetical protein
VFVAVVVFALAFLLMVVFFYVWGLRGDIFSETTTGWDAFLILAAISAIVAVGALVAVAVLVLRALLRSYLKDNVSNGGGANR